MVILFLRKDVNSHKGGKEGCSQPKNIAAFGGIEAYQAAEIEPVKTEGCGKAAHRGEHLSNMVHFALHRREHKNA